jgi:Uma2 family endonuclease
MSTTVAGLVSLEEYLNTSYSPDREYRDGVLVERNVGKQTHARLQALLAAYLIRYRKQWDIEVYTELRIKVREGIYRIPDLCVYQRPAPSEEVPDRPPLLWIEILSDDDKMVEVWARANELVSSGVPHLWIIDPHTLDSELRTAAGIVPVIDKTLRLPGSEIVIPLAEVVEQ